MPVRASFVFGHPFCERDRTLLRLRHRPSRRSGKKAYVSSYFLDFYSRCEDCAGAYSRMSQTCNTFCPIH
jgi:hypothetical protein